MEDQKKAVYSLVQGEAGEAWARRMFSGWDMTSKVPLCSWQGILCDVQDGSVIALELENVALQATLPTQLGILSSLEVLVLRKNKLYGTIPTQLGQLPKLEVLDLSLNNITGTLPKFKSNNLKDVSLAFNQISGEIGSDWPVGHELLVELDISWNKLTGSIPDSIGSMKALVNLTLSGNDLYGFVPTTIGKIPNIQTLKLERNLLIGRIPKELFSSNSKLSSINFEGNDLSGTLPEALANLKYLAELNIKGNKFTGEIPRQLCQAETSLEHQELSSISTAKMQDNCKNIACPINFLFNQETLSCEPCPYNFFSPYIGAEEMCMPMNENDILQTLWSVTYGPGWSKINNWNYDGVRTCSFTGVSCDDEGNVISIILRNFNLRGTIPKELSGLKHLKVLDLSDNMLTGHIPSDLRFAPLEKLDLSGNRLVGLIPPLLCRSEANDNGENGEYHCYNIICPSGTYGETGYGECLPCYDVDANDTLGRTTCISVDLPKSEVAILATLTFAASVVFSLVAVFVVIKVCRKRKHGLGEMTKEVPDSETVTTNNFQVDDAPLQDIPLKNGGGIITIPKDPRQASVDDSVEWRSYNRQIQQANKRSSEKNKDYARQVGHEDVWLDVPRIS